MPGFLPGDYVEWVSACTKTVSNVGRLRCFGARLVDCLPKAQQGDDCGHQHDEGDWPGVRQDVSERIALEHNPTRDGLAGIASRELCRKRTTIKNAIYKIV